MSNKKKTPTLDQMVQQAVEASAPKFEAALQKIKELKEDAKKARDMMGGVFTNGDYCAVFRYGMLYIIAGGTSPDMHQGQFSKKEEALLAARAFQIKRKADPNFILDLTNASAEELGEFLK